MLIISSGLLIPKTLGTSVYRFSDAILEITVNPSSYNNDRAFNKKRLKLVEACSTHGRTKQYKETCLLDSGSEKDHLGDKCINGRIILKGTQKNKYEGMYVLNSRRRELIFMILLYGNGLRVSKTLVSEESL
jgi:hypothetical protein